MITAQRGKNSFRKSGYFSARALIVAGFLFYASGALAYIDPGGCPNDQIMRLI